MCVNWLMVCKGKGEIYLHRISVFSDLYYRNILYFHTQLTMVQWFILSCLNCPSKTNLDITFPTCSHLLTPHNSACCEHWPESDPQPPEISLSHSHLHSTPELHRSEESHKLMRYHLRNLRTYNEPSFLPASSHEVRGNVVPGTFI